MLNNIVCNTIMAVALILPDIMRFGVESTLVALHANRLHPSVHESLLLTF